MKKMLFMLFLLGLMSCNVTQYYEPKFTLGMTEETFKEQNPSAVSVYGDDKGLIIYRTRHQITNAYKFFKFVNKKLVQFGEGVYPDDYKTLAW